MLLSTQKIITLMSESAKEPYDEISLAVSSFPMFEWLVPSPFLNLNLTNAVKSSLRNVAEGTLWLLFFSL